MFGRKLIACLSTILINRSKSQMSNVTNMFSYFNNYSKSNKNAVKIIKIMPTTSSSELSRDHVIENDLRSVLRPLNLILRLFFCAKYSIRNNIITSNTFFYNLFRVFGMLTYRCVLLYSWIIYIIENCDLIWGEYSLLFSSNMVVDFILFFIGDLVNIILSIMQSDYNILMVLKIQCL